MTTLTFLVLAAAFAALMLGAAACGTNPTGPVINNSGDGNTFNIPGDESSGNTVTTPAPVVTPPVVVTPPGSTT